MAAKESSAKIFTQVCQRFCKLISRRTSNCGASFSSIDIWKGFLKREGLGQGVLSIKPSGISFALYDARGSYTTVRKFRFFRYYGADYVGVGVGEQSKFILKLLADPEVLPGLQELRLDLNMVPHHLEGIASNR